MIFPTERIPLVYGGFNATIGILFSAIFVVALAGWFIREKAKNEYLRSRKAETNE